MTSLHDKSNGYHQDAIDFQLVNRMLESAITSGVIGKSTRQSE